MGDRTMFGKKLFVMRVQKKLTQKSLAAIAGVSNTTISYLEQGRSQMVTMKTLVKLAQAFDIDSDKLANMARDCAMDIR